ncbi:MAG TPA: type B 50S ribosomal protein L31 [Actinoallomurus sp.]|nr:type B 50S ribosomal protein L31 [Actinoallomurus sp.]
MESPGRPPRPYGRERAGTPGRSTATSETTVEWTDGITYPVIDVDVSSASHPFYTGRTRLVDTAGRVERFRRRYGKATEGGR